ncbi:hypothetical protein V7S43_000941 [Phytophthora oleae]|uniref:TNFR-Cys domain-containing protein n=1 Tax=Phytophthora oleae TaxID=2107226 RepID=A0ABD3G232_9STRA
MSQRCFDGNPAVAGQSVGHSLKEEEVVMDTSGRAIRTLGATLPESSTCSHFNSEYSECKVQVLCSLCISTGTCEFDVVSLSCKTKSASTNGTEPTYCSRNDTVCSSCIATSADPICTGEDGVCTCQTLCSVMEPDSSNCSNAEVSIIAYVGVVVGVICIASLVFLMVKCKRRYSAVMRQRSLEAQRRRESELLRIRQPQLALDLAGWRDTVELSKPELHKLGTCCYVTKKADTTAAVAAGDADLSTSMGTSSTFSEAHSPREKATAPSECDYNVMDDCHDV